MNPPATYQVLYFGLLADRRGLAEESVISQASTAKEFYETLAGQFPLAMPVAFLRAVVNDEFVPWDHPLQNGDRVAFLPPMSGG